MAALTLTELNEDDVFRGIERNLAAPVVDEWIIMDLIKPGSPVTVGITFNSAGSAKVEYTGNSVEKVRAGTANAIDWDFGTVTADKYGYFPSGMTAVRFTNIAGDIDAIIRS